MQPVSAEILQELCGLSPGPLAVAAVVGLTLWLFGWWTHRFWVVLCATVAGGVYGLFEGSAHQSQPLIASLVLALAAGMLALALVRLFAFLVGGMAGLIAIQSLAPALNQPLMSFLLAGLVGLLLFRWCVIGTTSLAGSVILIYAGLTFLNRQGSLDAVAWTEQGPVLLNWMCGVMTLMGGGFQVLLENRRRRRRQEDKASKKKSREDGSLDFLTRPFRRAG
jgi:hypothetical protein